MIRRTVSCCKLPELLFMLLEVTTAEV